MRPPRENESREEPYLEDKEFYGSPAQYEEANRCWRSKWEPSMTDGWHETIKPNPLAFIDHLSCRIRDGKSLASLVEHTQTKRVDIYNTCLDERDVKTTVAEYRFNYKMKHNADVEKDESRTTEFVVYPVTAATPLVHFGKLPYPDKNRDYPNGIWDGRIQFETDPFSNNTMTWTSLHDGHFWKIIAAVSVPKEHVSYSPPWGGYLVARDTIVLGLIAQVRPARTMPNKAPICSWLPMLEWNIRHMNEYGGILFWTDDERFVDYLKAIERRERREEKQASKVKEGEKAELSKRSSALGNEASTQQCNAEADEQPSEVLRENAATEQQQRMAEEQGELNESDNEHQDKWTGRWPS